MRTMRTHLANTKLSSPRKAQQKVRSLFDPGDRILSLRTRAESGKVRGQSIVLFALMMPVLVAMLGLAIDAGYLASLHRRAQNASDGAARGATRVMLTYYQWMISNNATDVDGDSTVEGYIADAVAGYAGVNGVAATDIESYFVDDNGVQVTADKGAGCGTAYGSVCKVGENGGVPWTKGVRGVSVRVKVRYDTFFMGLFGFRELDTSSQSTASMGVAFGNDTQQGLFPIGFVEDGRWLQEINPNREVTLARGRNFATTNSSAWAFLDFNGMASSGSPLSVAQAWAACGYNPAITSSEQWASWCSGRRKGDGATLWGPTKYWQGEGTRYGPFQDYSLRWGYGNSADGWSLATREGALGCSDMRTLLSSLSPDKGVYVPVLDSHDPTNGNAHLFAPLLMNITYVDVRCHIPTVPPELPGFYDYWDIRGTIQSQFSISTHSDHGNLRRASLLTVVLDP